MYEDFEKLLKERKIKTADVARATGISSSTFTDWKMGRYQPKSDKLNRIAEFFQVPVWYLQLGDVDHQLDEKIKDSDMLAFIAYVSRIGWSVSYDKDSDEYTLASSNVSICISGEQFELFENRIRNECVNGLLGYVAQAINDKYKDSVSITTTAEIVEEEIK